jgi:PKD repeat protein
LNSPLNFFWDFGDGNTSAFQNTNHTYTTAGTYTIKLIVSNCNFSDTITTTIQVGITSIAENIVGDFSIYPNPTFNQINLKIDDKLLGSIYTVYDNTGKSVLNGKIIAVQSVIELGELSRGIYLLSIGENFKQTFKVIKE